MGTGNHPGDLLHPLPSAVPSARALAEVLATECGMGDRVRLLCDPRSPSEVLAALAEAVDRAGPTEGRYESGVVVFCHVGHGLRGPGGRLYLATAATSSLTDTAHSVPYSEIERYLSDGPADPLIVLDCCFAGNAREPSRPTTSDPFGGSRPQGSYLLASAQRDTLAYAPTGAEYTLFTGHLLSLLREGDAGGPRLLTPGSLYRLLDQRLQGGPARPYGGGTARMAELVLTVNRRYAPRPEDAAPAADPDAVSPYPGIVPFLPEQHHLFFGREKVTRELLRRVAHRPGEPLVVIGTSGVGKSSLLRAGLTVAAEEAGLGPVRIVAAPGAHPFRALATAWAAAVGRPVAEVVRDLEQGVFRAADNDAGAPPGVLVVDQLEQYFTHAADPAEQRLFAAALTASHGPRIVLALRADYHDDALRDRHLGPLVAREHFTVPALDDAEIEAAIVGPARYEGLEWEKGVPQILRREVSEERAGDGPGDAAALPFLAHVLREIWLRRRGTTLTYAAYQEAGGIRDAVARTAERIYADLDDEGRTRLRELTLAMVNVADGEGRLVRRRVPREELVGSEDLLRRLADARLVVVDEQGGAQLGHDSLLYAWQRLHDWIDEVRGDLLRLRRLTEAAESWFEHGSGLWTGTSLDEARALVAAEGAAARPPVRQVVRDFVTAADRARRRRRSVTRAWIAGLSALALVAGVLAGWGFYENGQAADRERSLIARELAAQADIMRERDPRTALRLSLAAYRAAPTPETRSSLYSAATTVAPTHLTPADRKREPVLKLAYSPDGKVLAAGHRGGRVRLWDVTKPTVPVEAGQFELDGTGAIAHHPSKRLLAAQTARSLTLWDTTDPRAPRRVARLPITKSVTFTLAFSGDGRTLAAGGEAGRLRLWNVSDPAHPALRAERTIADAELISLAFTRDGRHLITGNGNGQGDSEQPAQVRLWDLTDPDRPALRDTERAETVMAVAAHPKRDLVVATGASGKVAWWELVGGRELRRVEVEEFRDYWGSDPDGIPSLSFSGDGRLLAGAERDNGVQRGDVTGKVSDLENWQDLAALPSGEPAQSVAFSPDSRYLAAGDVGGEIRLWPGQSWAPAIEGTVPSFVEAGTSAFSGDGRLVLAQTDNADYTTLTRVWDISDARAPKVRYTLPKGWEANYFLNSHKKPVLLAHYWTEGLEHTFQFWTFDSDGEPVRGRGIHLTADVPRVVVSPDGRLLAAGSAEEQGIALYDIEDPAKPVRVGTVDAPISGDLFTTGELWFAGDRALATIEDRADLVLWDLSDPARPRKAGRVKDVALMKRAMYDAGSRQLVTEEVGDVIRVWDLSRPARPAGGGRIPGAPGAYFPTGKGELATALSDGTVQFWDVTDPARPQKKRDLRLDRAVSFIAMTPDGRHAVTGSPYRIWTVGPDGEWDFPEFVELANAEDLHLPRADSPEGLSWLAVTVERTWGSSLADRSTYVLDFDTDQLYQEMCKAYPQSVPKDQWEGLFPHLSYRTSCA
ncbi:nSTAND1 domain-containing NTPase [Streptomyces spinoverrucosus]|uniref:nSTAND1 domain-containing NTPase n=1 Tax=Streptomyces spinoverrucosus TaxID=284043 RepID=UPI001142DC41|nr:caspase family protein [Streptomyces spinoverrucosus]